MEAQEQRDLEVDSPKLKGSKLVMPEYVVGTKKVKSNKVKETKQERAAGKLMLSHLQDDEDDDDGTNDE